MNKPDLPKDWVVLSGKPYPTWPAVLAVAHERGLCGIETELIQIPTAENGMEAIVRATATFSAERFGCPASFSALGDASPRNVNAKIATALIRMCETRAKGRALRDACNIGQTLAEELPDTEADNGHRGGSAAATARPAPAPAPRVAPAPPAPVADSHVVCSVDGCGVVLNEGEIKTCEKFFPGDPLVCKEHAKARARAIKEAEGATHGVG